MSIKQLVRDDDAVSPVIGVILMVAITVILAAVIGAFVLGIGGDLNQTPNTNLGISADSDYNPPAATNDNLDQDEARAIVIDHKGGDALQAENIRVVVRDSSGDQILSFDSLDSGAITASDAEGVYIQPISSASDTLEVADRAEIRSDDSSSLASHTGTEVTVELIHKPSDGVVAKSTVTLAS